MMKSTSHPKSEVHGSQHDNWQTSDYILHSWEKLTRTMNGYASFVDVKVKGQPVLYLPAGLPVDDNVSELHNLIAIKSLPRIIQRMGDVKPEDLPAPGLLYLPYPYVIPGGRFNEMYGWDSYFIVLGLISSGLYDLAKGMADNLLYEVKHYGTVLNANRSYYLTRSQPPFLTAMILSVYKCKNCFPDDQTRRAWLEEAYELAAKYHSTWMQPHHFAGSTGLSRYFDLESGPVPEYADHSSYFHDIINWLLTHPLEDPGYLIRNRHQADSDSGAQGAHAVVSPRTGVMRERASVKSHSLTEDFYLGDRAMRESGFDCSFRFGSFCGLTHHFAPVCLNSLLYRYERDMACLAGELNRAAEEQNWNAQAERRADEIQKYLWRENEGMFMDYNFVRELPSGYRYLSTYYPMWAGLATREQAELLRKNLHIFERSGGLSMSSKESGMQWDEPYGWAPCNWIVVESLKAYGYIDDALRIAKAFVGTIDKNFARDANMREKYDVVKENAEVHVTAGYKENVIGFGWTNGVYLKMLELLAESAE
jgi:alpha,alpha-trehalase